MILTLKLQKLTFDRKTVNGRPAAIPVRAKSTGPVESADWRGSNVKVTPVAYPLSLTAADITDLRITATFAAATPLSGPVFIRAIGAHDRILGDLVSLQFAPSDVGQPKQFRLTGVQLPQKAIDAFTVAWNWEWSVNGQGNWQQFASSSHPVFVIVDQLKAPWGRGHAAGDPHTVVPWQDVMSLACTWGKGLRRADKVVEAITIEVDKLAGTPIGGDVVKYQNGGNLCYGKKFCINDIPLIVKKHPNATKRLNCQDINTTIAMFSTILGSDVRLITLLPNDGAATINTNKIRVFGRKNETNEPFQYHEVAARPDLPIGERPVWDACLKVDFDANPAAAPPGDFDLPISLTIHQTGMDLGYRKRMLASGSQNCIIANVETDGLRYPGGVPADGPATPAPDPHYQARRLRFARMMAGVPISGPTSSDLLLRFEEWLDGVAREGFRRLLDASESGATVQFTPLSPVVTGGSPMLAEVVIAESGEQAVDVFLTLAANHAGPLNAVEIGDFGLQDPGRTVLFIRGPVVAFLSDANDEVDAPSNFDAAQRLDENLKPLFEAQPRPV